MEKVKKNKNDYSCTAFRNGEKVNFMKFVHRVSVYRSWLKENNIQWDYINVYYRRNGEFIERIYP